MRKILTLLLCFSLAVGQLIAQNRTIKGKVTDDKGAPVANASVIVKGTTSGTKTSDDGTFSINVQPNIKALVVSSIGFANEEIVLGNNTYFSIKLTSADKSLDEVVVVGYQQINKRSLTGAVAKVDGKTIADKPVLSFDQALTAKASGVQINTSSGLVGDNVIIRIRGAASISSGSQPLIVLDGVPLTQGDQGQLYNPANALADINPNDIESVEVLKDASAAAIYGSRASAGVLLITTKKGKAGNATKVNYDMYVGVNNPTRRMKVLDANAYTSTINTMRSNASLANVANDFDYTGSGTLQKYNTNWQDQVFRNGMSQNHQVSIQGASGASTYYASVNYNDFENYIINNQQKRGSVRLNVENKATKWLTVGINTQYSRTQLGGLGSGTGGAASGVPLGPLVYFPNVPVYDPTNPTDFYLGQGGNTFSMGIIPNPVAVLKANYDVRETRRYLASGYAEATIIKGLKFKTQYNVDYQTAFTDQFWNPNVGDGSGLAGVAQTVYDETKTWTWYNTLNYNTKIAGKHNLGVLAGVEYNRSKGKFAYSYGLGIVDEQLKIIDPANYSEVGAQNGLTIENGLASYFGSINYDYLGKYLLSANFRADAFSDFGKDNKFGYFPSVSAAWRISDENFFKKQSIFADAKLRVSYGITGNSNLPGGLFPSRPTYASVQYADIPGLTLNTPGNANLKWERTGQFDIGLDASLVKGKVNIVMDYYVKKTKDLILNSPVIATLGIPGNSLIQNIGQLESKGFELTVNTTNIAKKDFTWTTSFNMAWQKTTVIATNAVGDDVAGGNSLARPGYKLGAYYLIRWAGVNPQTGWATFYDKDGVQKQFNPSVPAAQRWTTVKDGATTTAITAADRYLDNSKTPYPTFFGGITNTFQYKSFDLSFDIQYSLGAYTYNSTLAGLMTYTNQRNKSEYILNSWKNPGDATNVPKLFWNDNQQSQASTRWLEKSDFARIRNLTFGYSLPKSLLSKVSISRLRVYVQAQNLVTFTGYKGIDPEANANGNVNIGLGIDNFRPYLPRVVSFGLNLGL